jgi:hypothetical protein
MQVINNYNKLEKSDTAKATKYLFLVPEELPELSLPSHTNYAAPAKRTYTKNHI